MEITAGRKPPGKHCINSCANWTLGKGQPAGTTKKQVSARFAFERMPELLINAKPGHAGKVTRRLVGGRQKNRKLYDRGVFAGPRQRGETP